MVRDRSYYFYLGIIFIFWGTAQAQVEVNNGTGSEFFFYVVLFFFWGKGTTTATTESVTPLGPTILMSGKP
jgi:hypothetical protein